MTNLCTTLLDRSALLPILGFFMMRMFNGVISTNSSGPMYSTQSSKDIFFGSFKTTVASLLLRTFVAAFFLATLTFKVAVLLVNANNHAFVHFRLWLDEQNTSFLRKTWRKTLQHQFHGQSKTRCLFVESHRPILCTNQSSC